MVVRIPSMENVSDLRAHADVEAVRAMPIPDGARRITA